MKSTTATPWVPARGSIYAIAAASALMLVMQAGVGSDTPVAPPTAAGLAPAAQGAAPDVHEEHEEIVREQPWRWFNNRPVLPARTLRMTVTAYSPDERSCGSFADGLTASGYSVWTNGGRLVAADTDLLPMGSLITVPGYDGGAVVPVLDRGGRIKGSRLDVLYPTHEAARRWGVREVEVTVWEYADGLPCDFEMRW